MMTSSGAHARILARYSVAASDTVATLAAKLGTVSDILNRCEEDTARGHHDAEYIRSLGECYRAVTADLAALLDIAEEHVWAAAVRILRAA